MISARVESIDKAQRQLMLKGPKGNVQTVTAGPEVGNFDQIKVGDMVVARFMEALTLTLKKEARNSSPRQSRPTARARPPARSPPASSAARSR